MGKKELGFCVQKSPLLLLFTEIISAEYFLGVLKSTTVRALYGATRGVQTSARGSGRELK